MGLRYKGIQIRPADIISCKNNRMVGRKLPNRIPVAGAEPVQPFQIIDVPVLQHLDKFHKNLRCGPRIIHRTVMILQRNIQGLRYYI